MLRLECGLLVFTFVVMASALVAAAVAAFLGPEATLGLAFTLASWTFWSLMISWHPMQLTEVTGASAIGFLLSTIVAFLAVWTTDPSREEVAAFAKPLPGDIVIGDDSAPLTVVEYSSLSCDDCADFHLIWVSIFIERQVVAGEARYVYRHFPTDEAALRAAVAVDCVDAERRPEALQLLYQRQAAWVRSGDVTRSVSMLLGPLADTPGFAACAADETRMNGIVDAMARPGMDLVEGLPTFVVGDRVLTGTVLPSEFKEAVGSLSLTR